LLQEEVSLAVGLALVGILFLALAAYLVIMLSVENYPAQSTPAFKAAGTTVLNNRALALGSSALLRAPAIRGGITDVLNRVVKLAILIALCASSSGRAQQAPAPWPILYFDAEGLHAVYPDGRRAKAPGWDFRVASFPTWSPTGLWFAYAGNEATTLELMNLSGERRKLFASNQEFVGQFSWSPDGKLLAAVLVRGPPPTASLAVFEVGPGRLAGRYRVPGVPSIVEWSHDGHKVLLAADTAVFVDALTSVVDTVAAEPVCPFWAPGSDAVYYFAAKHPPCGDLTGFLVRRPDLPQPTRLLDRDQLSVLGLAGEDVLAGPMHLLAVSPSGTKLAIWASTTSAGRPASTIRVYDLPEGSSLALDKPAGVFRTDALIYALQWGPDEVSLAGLTASPEMELRIIELRTGTWKTLAKLKYAPDLDIMYLGRTSMSWTR